MKKNTKINEDERGTETKPSSEQRHKQEEEHNDSGRKN